MIWRTRIKTPVFSFSSCLVSWPLPAAVSSPVLPAAISPCPERQSSTDDERMWRKKEVLREKWMAVMYLYELFHKNSVTLPLPKFAILPAPFPSISHLIPLSCSQTCLNLQWLWQLYRKCSIINTWTLQGFVGFFFFFWGGVEFAWGVCHLRKQVFPKRKISPIYLPTFPDTTNISLANLNTDTYTWKDFFFFQFESL